MEAQDLSYQPKKYTCSHDKCGYQTNKLFNFQRHRKIHEKKAQMRELSTATHAAPNGQQHNLRDSSPAPKIQRLETFQIECAQSGCPFVCEQLEEYTDHVQNVHEKSLQFVHKQFEDKESLEAFMRSLQERTVCSMVMSRTFDTDVGESFELCCATSGQIRHAADGGVVQTRDRSGIYCTFYLQVTLIDGVIKVRGCESHFGHSTNTLSTMNNNNNDSALPPSTTAPTTASSTDRQPATPTPPTPTMPMSVVQPTLHLSDLALHEQQTQHQQQQQQRLLLLPKTQQRLADEVLSGSPDSSASGASSHSSAASAHDDSLRSTSQNLSPMRDEIEKLVVKEDLVAMAPEPRPDYQSEIRRIALDLQSETELFLESDSAQLAAHEFHELEKASATIIDVLRRARVRGNAVAGLPSAQLFHAAAAAAAVSQSPDALNTPTSAFMSVSSASTQPRLSAALLNSHQQQLQQLQQALRGDVPLSQRVLAPSLVPNNSLLQNGAGLPSLTNAALLLSAVQRQHAVQQLNGHHQLGNGVAANVLSTLASTIQQQQQQSQQANGLLVVPGQHQHTAVVPPQPHNGGVASTSPAPPTALPTQNARFEELVRKAIIELDAQRRSTCAQCHRKDPPFADHQQQQQQQWLDCQRCCLKFHAQCVPDVHCAKCKTPL